MKHPVPIYEEAGWQAMVCDRIFTERSILLMGLPDKNLRGRQSSSRQIQTTLILQMGGETNRLHEPTYVRFQPEGTCPSRLTCRAAPERMTRDGITDSSAVRGRRPRREICYGGSCTEGHRMTRASGP